MDTAIVDALNEQAVDEFVDRVVEETDSFRLLAGFRIGLPGNATGI